MKRKISRELLREAGWPEGPGYGELFAAVGEYEARGISDTAYILKLLARRFPKPDPKIQLRDEPIPFGVAIRAENQEEEKNVAAVRRQMQQLLRTPCIVGGAVMPDACPVGGGEAVIPVGGAIAVEGAIIPSAHSSDVCCSMYATIFSSDASVGTLLDDLMRSTRFGPGGRSRETIVADPVTDEPVWTNPFLKGLEGKAVEHIADQGDGNHFAFLGELEITDRFVADLRSAGYAEIADSLDEVKTPAKRHVLVTHHGSRGLGAQVFKRGQKAAVTETAKIAREIPAAAAWLDVDTPIGADYWEALQYVGRWTKANHRLFLEHAGADAITEFGNEHNFVWKRGDHFLHGKGATPAWSDEEGRPLLGLIPLNMAEPILITLGKGNPDYLGFAPHGAGRNRSRTATRREFKNKDGSLDEEAIASRIAETTEGLDVRWWHGKPDLTETPTAYKSANAIREQIDQFDLAEVIGLIEPLGCIMAGDGGPQPWLSRKDRLSPKQIRQMEHRADRRKLKQSIQHHNENDDDEY